jgi:hydroxymethylbilane synthase
MTAASLTIGSRGSQLALWQAHYIAESLKALGAETRIEVIRTTGDHLQTASLAQAGGKGLFTKEIEEALLAGQIDLAVHSLKDLPTDLPEGLDIAAIPVRQDPHDALVGCTLSQLRTGARVGTSSLRRAAQLLLLRPDLVIEPIRGNVDTRLRKVKEGEYTASLLAVAGLRRLGLGREVAQVFSVQEMCPAPGQGALAVQTRSQGVAKELCGRLDDLKTRQAVTCERAVLAALGGGCQLPVGALAESLDGVLRISAIIVTPGGGRYVRAEAQGAAAQAREVGEATAADLLRRGGSEILHSLAAAL